MDKDPVFYNMPLKEQEDFLRKNGQVKRVGEISDGYHTFDELYDHRCLLFIHLLSWQDSAWMSKKHHDGSEWEGWFITGCNLERFKAPITYHLPMKYWELAVKFAKVLEIAPEWDGHTSNDVLERLKGELI